MRDSSRTYTKEEIRKRRIRKKRAILRRTQNKIGVAFLVVMVLLLILSGVVFKINYTKNEEYSKIVLDNQTYTSKAIPYKRGQIISSDGTILAYSQKVYNLILDVKFMLLDDANRSATVNALVSCFPQLDRGELEQRIDENRDSQYQKLLKNLTADQIASFQAILNDKEKNPKVKGAYFEENYLRTYPNGDFCADLIGFASNSNGGELGVELQYDKELSGVNGLTHGYVNDSLDVAEEEKSALDGNNVVLTIDYKVQSVVESVLKQRMLEYPAKDAAVIVMNPNNGEILGMASYPSFDLNNPRDLSSVYTQEQLDAMSDEETQKAMIKLWTNYCVSTSYEPGSVFKTVTVASGLDSGAIRDGDTFFCGGSEQVADYTINCWALGHGVIHGTSTVEDGLSNSCNPVMMGIVRKIGNERFAKYIQMFGFGGLTGIDLPGETEGIVRNASAMTTIDACTNSFGQNLNVNMIQMISSYCAVINGGNYYKPHVVRRIESNTGEIIKEYKAELQRQVVTPDTSEYMKRYLETTVSKGTANGIAKKGFAMGGKTGTAEKLPRSDKRWLASYIGNVPAQDPKFVVYVVIDDPEWQIGTEGSSSDAQLVASDIIDQLIPYYNIFMDPLVEQKINDEKAKEALLESGVGGIPSDANSTNGITETAAAAAAADSMATAAYNDTSSTNNGSTTSQVQTTAVPITRPADTSARTEETASAPVVETTQPEATIAETPTETPVETTQPEVLETRSTETESVEESAENSEQQ